jgi:hypothetical protein
MARLTAVILLTVTTNLCLAWGPETHRVVGHLALEQLTPAARAALISITDSDDADVIAQACNWPDDYRATPEGKWTAPQHYINVPLEASGYESARDCREGGCVSGAIQQYAGELGDPNLPRQQRWQAWARVCHFVGDIHQPLHVGYVHDRGGNGTQVYFRGELLNLHHFWDHTLSETNYSDWRALVTDLSVDLDEPAPANWTTSEVDGWARESHRLVRQVGYPPEPEISREFAASSWLLARDRLSVAGRRLARILNTVLPDSD